MTIEKNYLQGEITNFMPYRIGWRFNSNEFKIYFYTGKQVITLVVGYDNFSDGWVLQALNVTSIFYHLLIHIHPCPSISTFQEVSKFLSLTHFYINFTVTSFLSYRSDFD